jgi:hypothetical protein
MLAEGNGNRDVTPDMPPAKQGVGSHQRTLRNDETMAMCVCGGHQVVVQSIVS